jgi:hypothetical protein
MNAALGSRSGVSHATWLVKNGLLNTRALRPSRIPASIKHDSEHEVGTKEDEARTKWRTRQTQRMSLGGMETSSNNRSEGLETLDKMSLFRLF